VWRPVSRGGEDFYDSCRISPEIQKKTKKKKKKKRSKLRIYRGWVKVMAVIIDGCDVLLLLVGRKDRERKFQGGKNVNWPG
jgi:hypothetical protein